MTSLMRLCAGAVRRHAGIALALLAFAAGITGGAGLYIGVDGYYIRVTAANPDVQPLTGYPSMRLRAIEIPVTSLKGQLAELFGAGGTAQAGTITGYEFSSAWNKSAPVCLGAVGTSPSRGQNGDPVQALTCSNLALNEIWIPAQWEENHSKLTWLVNYQYQSECLNANSYQGHGSPAKLWDCYSNSSNPDGIADNEAWDFGDWYANMQSGVNPFPIFLGSGDLCLDADKFNADPKNNNDLPDGTKIIIWDYDNRAPDQYWYSG